MRNAPKRHLYKLLSVALTLTLSGCMGTLKMPINEYSHFNIEASPFGGELQISYHLYDELPQHAYTEDWTGDIQIDSLGTVYDSEKEISPLVTRIDRAWEKVKKAGPINWATVERLIVESNAEAEAEAEKASKPSKIKPKAIEPWQRTGLPVAEIPLFLFSSPPGW
jgi:hypothetical protein